MTRETPQGTHDTPAWLGEIEDEAPLPADTRDTVRVPPVDGVPLWPAEPDRRVRDLRDPDLGAPDLGHPDLGAPDPGAPDLGAPDAVGGPRPIEPVYTDADVAYPTTYRESAYADPAPAAGPAHAAYETDETARLGTLGVVTVTGRRPMRPPSSPRPGRRHPRRPGSTWGLLALVLLALASAFFAWVTAEPLWLAAGHAQTGTVTVTRCVEQRCTGVFTSADGRIVREAVPVMGDVPDTGGTAPARMTSARGARAYVDVDAAGRAAAGVALIVLCGLGIVWATGVRRLPTRRARTAAVLLSLGAPLTLLAGMLATTY